MNDVGQHVDRRPDGEQQHAARDDVDELAAAGSVAVSAAASVASAIARSARRERERVFSGSQGEQQTAQTARIPSAIIFQHLLGTARHAAMLHPWCPS